MSGSDSLDRLVGELLAGLFAAEGVGALERRTAAAARDEHYRDRYAALTGRALPAPREIRAAHAAARVAAAWRRRYGVADPPDPE